jgi:hypothetical protein
MNACASVGHYSDFSGILRYHPRFQSLPPGRDEVLERAVSYIAAGKPVNRPSLMRIETLELARCVLFRYHVLRNRTPKNFGGHPETGNLPESSGSPIQQCVAGGVLEV